MNVGEILEPWMKDEPFTKEEVDAFNRYTHFPSDINKEFRNDVQRKEAEVMDKFQCVGLTELTDAAKTALRYYRKALYEFYLAKSRARSIAPPVSVVGPARYPTHRIPQAQKIEQVALEKVETAKKYIDKAIREATRGMLPIEEIKKWMSLAQRAKNRIEFGKLYAGAIKDEIKQKPEAELTGYDRDVLRGIWDHVFRGQGRVLYDRLLPEIEKARATPYEITKTEFIPPPPPPPKPAKQETLFTWMR